MKHPLTPRYRQLFLMLFLLTLSGVVVFFAFERIDTIGGAIRMLVSIISPFLVGALIAFLLKPVCNRLDVWIGNWMVRHVLRRRIESGKTTERRVHRFAEVISIILAIILFFGILAGILMIIIPSIVKGIINLRDGMPGYIANLDAWFVSINTPGNPIGQVLYNLYVKVSDLFKDSSSGDVFQSLIDKLLANYKSILDNIQNIASTTGKIVSVISSAVINVVVSVVSAFNILYNRKRFAAQATMITRAVFKRSIADWLIREAQFADRKFSEFFTGKLLDSFLVGVILYIVFLIFGIPVPALVAVFMGICNMIPFFGPYIGSIPSLLLIFLFDPTNPIKILYFLVIVIVVQQLDGNILDPFIVGDNIGLSSFWVLFAVIVFGDLFGFVGLLIGVPLFAVIYDLIRQLVNWALRRRGEEQLMTEYTYIFHNPEDERAAGKKRARAIKEARMQARAKEEAARAEATRLEYAVAVAEEAARQEDAAREEAERAAAEEAARQNEPDGGDADPGVHAPDQPKANTPEDSSDPR